MSEARLSQARPRSSACAYCGTPADPGARFCQTCGHTFPRPIDPACPHCRSPYLPGTAYCESCGASLPPTPYLTIMTSGVRLPLFTTERTAITIGRADALSGVAPDLNLEPYGGALPGLSRRHARLLQQNDRYWLEDLNSVNLTYLNQQRLTPAEPVLLQDGDSIRFGNLAVTFHSR
jgi:hypothetical protein